MLLVGHVGLILFLLITVMELVAFCCNTSVRLDVNFRVEDRISSSQTSGNEND